MTKIASQFSTFGGQDNLQTPFDVSVIITSVGRLEIVKTIQSIFEQQHVGRIQILIGIDKPINHLEHIFLVLNDCPPHITAQIIYPGYSTSIRHGGVHAAYDGGAMRTILSFIANSQYIAYIDDDNWWGPSHLSDLLLAIKGKAWAFSLRWFVHPESRIPVGVDLFESVGIGKGVFADQFGGFLDPNCLMVDKLACLEGLHHWSQPPEYNVVGLMADRCVFNFLKGHSLPGATNKATAFYVMNANDENHSIRQQLLSTGYQGGASIPSNSYEMDDCKRARNFITLNQDQVALNTLNKVIESNQNHLEAINQKAWLLLKMGQPALAKEAALQCLNINPKLDEALLNLCYAQLTLGEWSDGWRNYEIRKRHSSFGQLQISLPHWQGKNEFKHEGLIIITEQGFGDVFQFSRYIDIALKRFKKVAFIGSSQTHQLIEDSFGDRIEVMTQFPTQSDTWHWHCHLLSLPLAFNTQEETIPQKLPYLRADPNKVLFWKKRLGALPAAVKKIGIAWSGRPSHQFDTLRSIDLSQFIPLFETTLNVAWVSLQKDAPQPLSTIIEKMSHGVDWSDDLVDFSDTAALIENLDLVISIDSAIAHLAGGLNKPVWMLNRFGAEWRWLNNRVDSPWYPNMKIFNQSKPMDWVSVIKEVRKELS